MGNRLTRNRRQQKQQQKNQRGGSCTARPLNRQLFERRQNQRGGMAPIGAPGLLLDNATRIQAQVADLDRYIDDSQMLVRQAGGRRSQRQQKRQSRRQRQQQRQRQSRRNRNQRGGMAPFGYELERPAGADVGLNPQFRDEATVNSLYNEFKGPQGMLT